jgi:hypothetical protein
MLKKKISFCNEIRYRLFTMIRRGIRISELRRGRERGRGGNVKQTKYKYNIPA